MSQDMSVPDLTDICDDPLELLTQWYRQWIERDDMPSKMSDSLHVKTAITLLAHGRIDGNGRKVEPPPPPSDSL